VRFRARPRLGLRLRRLHESEGRSLDWHHQLGQVVNALRREQPYRIRWVAALIDEVSKAGVEGLTRDVAYKSSQFASLVTAEACRDLAPRRHVVARPDRDGRRRG
jgi:hypothetical protein